MAHSKINIIVMLAAISAIVLSRGPMIAGTLVNNLVAKGITNKLMLVSLENLSPQCGYGREGTQKSNLATFAELFVKLFPANGLAWLNLGQVHWAQGQCDDALVAFEKSSNFYETLINPAQFQLARALYSLGERQRSITIFQSIGGGRYVEGQADFANQNGDYQSAITLYVFALEIDPLPQIGVGFTDMVAQVTNLSEASSVGVWRELVLETPADQPTHWLVVGEQALLAGDIQTAKDAFLRGLALSNNPEYFYLFFLSLARTSEKMEDWNGAVNYYSLALDLNPSASITPYLKIAEIESTLGNYIEVVAWCDKARLISPDSKWPDFAQGYAAFRLGRLDEAKTLFNSALNKVPGDPSSLYYLGLISESQNNILESARYFEQAASGNNVPSQACAWFLQAGDLYQRVGEISKADQMYEKGITICPSDSTLYERLQAVTK